MGPMGPVGPLIDVSDSPCWVLNSPIRHLCREVFSLHIWLTNWPQHEITVAMKTSWMWMFFFAYFYVSFQRTQRFLSGQKIDMWLTANCFGNNKTSRALLDLCNIGMPSHSRNGETKLAIGVSVCMTHALTQAKGASAKWNLHCANKWLDMFERC